MSLPFLVANSVHDLVPPAPPGYVRLESQCTLCKRGVTWIMRSEKTKDKEVICGYCALDLFKKSN